MSKNAKFKIENPEQANVWLPCSKCNVETNHSVMTRVNSSDETEDGDIQVWDAYEILQCRGCRTISYRHHSACTEDAEPTDSIYPSRNIGRHNSFVIPKIKALRNVIMAKLKDPRARYYDPLHILEYFERFAILRDELIRIEPEAFSDLPVREMPSALAIINGRRFIQRVYMEKLYQDIEYCIDVLSNLSEINIPEIKVTKEGVFFVGQYFDALKQVQSILSNAKKSIVIIDGYVDSSVLNLLTEKQASTEVNILTKNVPSALKTAADAFKKQYGSLNIRTSNAYHDRFVIIDDNEFYHFGASIKDLGTRGFMFSLIEEKIVIDALWIDFQRRWNSASICI